MKLPPWKVMLLAVFSGLAANSSVPTRLDAMTGICMEHALCLSLLKLTAPMPGSTPQTSLDLSI